MQHALESVEAAYISVHTLSPQHANAAGQGFMEVEMNGLQNIVTSCQAHGVRRLNYVTSLGIAPDAPSAWLRERWKTEQFLLNSGLDVTVIRPGQIVGVGGRGFDTMVSQAKRPVSINLLGGGQQKMRNIAVDDLVYYLVGVLNDPRAYGQCYDVGCDDILTNNQMMDITVELLGRHHPIKPDVPQTLLSALAPLIERTSKLPRGSIKGVLDSLKTDAIGDPMPIRTILPRPPLPYRQAVERALTCSSCHSALGRTSNGLEPTLVRCAHSAC
jgi:uncharacterized protein YbjT (DUF2867 family)